MNQSNGHHDPALQLSISIGKPNHILEVLEDTKKNDQVLQKVTPKQQITLCKNANNYPPVNFRVVHITWTKIFTKHVTKMTRLTN